MKRKEIFKNHLIITFVVVEVLSIMFNSFFIKFKINGYIYYFNYSVIFFCLGFFIVDTINLFYSSVEAKKFFYYKVYSQVIFLILATSAIKVNGLENTQFFYMIKSSWWPIFCGIVATFIGYNIMNAIMSKLKRAIYQGRSFFRQYIYSTLPGEFAFSLIFTLLTFSNKHNSEEVLSIFITSCISKLIFSTFFSAFMSFFLYTIFFNSKNKFSRIGIKNPIEEI